MRVLFLDHISFLGGGQKSMLALMDGLRQQGGFELRLLVPQGELAIAAGQCGYTVDTFMFGAIKRNWNPLRWIAGAWLLLSAVGTIIGIIRDHEIEIIHANSLKTAILGGLAARITGREAIFHARDFLAAGLFGRALVHWAYRVSDRIIVNSRAVAGVFGNNARGKVAVVYNSIDQPLALTADVRQSMRGAHGIPPNAPLIGYIGRLHPEKGLETLLTAFKSIAEKLPAARLWIIGAPMPGEEPYQDTLLGITRQLGIAGSVRFWGWRHDATGLMNCFDLCVVPSVREPFGRVTVEAMMLGVPVVATASGGTLEIIDDGVDGLLFPPGDAVALAGRCLKLINDTGVKNRLTNHAAEKATRTFGKAQYIAGTLAVYASLAGQ